MKSTTTVQVDTDTLLRLIGQLRIRGGSQDLSDAITSAIELWLREQSTLASGSDPASVRGYQWKSLFLPEGTVLRSWSYGENNYARVEGDKIIHKGKAVSPNQFAQSFARTTRNAWTDLYIRRPEDKHFTLACRLRQERAEQAKQGIREAQRDAPVMPDKTTLALIAALHAQTLAPAPSPGPAQSIVAPSPPRERTPGEGWDLPERRKYRFRIEDVAFN
jgi:hypothetical protein